MNEALVCPYCGREQYTHEPDDISALMCLTTCEHCDHEFWYAVTSQGNTAAGATRRDNVKVNMDKLTELDSHWNEVMELVVRYGFITQAYGGTATLATHKNQLEALGEEQYLYRQRSMNGIDMEEAELIGSQKTLKNEPLT